MKIVVISEYNLFTTIGGTEYYVDMLMRGLCKEGHELLLLTKGKQKDAIIKKVQQEGESSYQICFLPAIDFSKAEVKQQIVSASWAQMLPVLSQFGPDLIHVHTLTTFFNIKHFEVCVKKFQRIIFTSHIPGHFCSKGDLIQNNQRPCDGVIGRKCSVCLFSKSIKAGVANLVFSHYQKPLFVLGQLNKLSVQIICAASWQKVQLVRNGYAENKIRIIRQALVTQNYQQAVEQNRQRKFSVGYLGRLSPEKGSSLLLQLIRDFKDRDDLRFVLGIPENSNPADMKMLKQLILEEEADIVLLQSVHAENKHEFFEQIDCLIIPSFCIETGPIVLLEAVLYKKIVIAPGIGGPLEFSREFPDEVHIYKWNNISSLKDTLKHVHQKKTGTDRNYSSFFSEKEILFIKDHIALYNKMLSMSSN